IWKRSTRDEETYAPFKNNAEPADCEAAVRGENYGRRHAPEPTSLAPRCVQSHSVLERVPGGGVGHQGKSRIPAMTTPSRALSRVVSMNVHGRPHIRLPEYRGATESSAGTMDTSNDHENVEPAPRSEETVSGDARTPIRPNTWKQSTADDAVLAEIRRTASLPGGSPLTGSFYDSHRSPGSVG